MVKPILLISLIYLTYFILGNIRGLTFQSEQDLSQRQNDKGYLPHKLKWGGQDTHDRQRTNGSKGRSGIVVGDLA